MSVDTVSSRVEPRAWQLAVARGSALYLSLSAISGAVSGGDVKYGDGGLFLKILLGT